MREIPSESRLYLLPYACGVIGALSSASTAARMQTMKTMLLHFIKWCLKMGLVDPTLAHYDIPSKNFLMACYAVSLTSNETIFCKTIKTSAVNLYLSDATKLAIFKNLPDPTENQLNQKSSYIINVTNEHKRWESMPNRREPLTFSMVDFSFKTTLAISPDHNTLEAALTDWFIIGMQSGMRKSEWCQDRYTLQKTKQVIFNRDGSSSAFIFDDFTFEKICGVRCDNSRSSVIQQAALVKIRWCFQKNGNNGEFFSFLANDLNPARCPVCAALRIRARAIVLGVPPHLPIAVFRNKNNFSQYIDDFHVTYHFQSLAKEVYIIRASDELARFSTHSIRVGACVLLHETSQTPDFIKARLRWRSDAYLMNLRNTPKLASLHTQAVNNSI